MAASNIYVSDLSASRHVFNKYHFCRGNSNRRKSRLGIIRRGSGAYIYLGKRLKVAEGDVVFIPENVYCYSEWHGEPVIDVVYLSSFLHYESFKYEPQRLDVDEEVKGDILAIANMLSEGGEVFEAYSRFYRLLGTIIEKLTPSELGFNKTLQNAVEYITANFDKPFSVGELARRCCVSESTLYHLFKSELGETPVGFLNSVRINVAIEYLENTTQSVSTVSRKVGFNSENHFRRVFSELVGVTPLKYRKRS